MIEVISDFLRIIFLIPLYFPSLAIIYIFSYFVGSIPFAFLLTKIFGFGDIRKIGSGNIGATNVLRTGNKLLAFSVLIFDILKGFLLIFILKNYFFALIIDFDQITYQPTISPTSCVLLVF